MAQKVNQSNETGNIGDTSVNINMCSRLKLTDQTDYGFAEHCFAYSAVQTAVTAHLKSK